MQLNEMVWLWSPSSGELWLQRTRLKVYWSMLAKISQIFHWTLDCCLPPAVLTPCVEGASGDLGAWLLLTFHRSTALKVPGWLLQPQSYKSSPVWLWALSDPFLCSDVIGLLQCVQCVWALGNHAGTFELLSLFILNTVHAWCCWSISGAIL